MQNSKQMSFNLSSTLPDIDPDTAYVGCISVSLGFRQKPSDTALLSVIVLITFNCIVSASVTKGAIVCVFVTVHWWRHRTHYDVTAACRTLRNIPTVHLNSGAPRADLRGIHRHCKVTAKAGRQSTMYMGDFDAIFFITRYWIKPYSYYGFYGPDGVLGILLNRGSGLRPPGFTWQVTSAHLAGDVIQVWINSSPSNHGISHFKAQLAQLFSILCVRTGYKEYFMVTRYGQADIPREVSNIICFVLICLIWFLNKYMSFFKWRQHY